MDQGQVDISPGISVLGVLSHLNYEPWYALSEFVDNALQSARTDTSLMTGGGEPGPLAVDIEIDLENHGQIVITDNAGGIHRSDFARAFRTAEVPPDRSGLSEFGMGMKSASIWFSRRWSVETTSVNDPQVYTVNFDMDEILAGRVAELPVTSADAPTEAHFTRITLRDLNQFPRGRTLGKIREHMRDIYRMFLRSGRLSLTVAGEKLDYREPAILEAPYVRSASEQHNRNAAAENAQHESLLWKKDVAIELPGGATVSGFAALREQGSTRHAGFALFRRDRAIVGSGETPYRPRAIFGSGNTYRAQRLFGELHVDGLAVSHTKDGFQWGELEDIFLQALRAQLDADPLPLLRQAERYRSRATSDQQVAFISQATDRTAKVVAQHVPVALQISDTAGSGLSTPSPGQPTDVAIPPESRVVEFQFDDRTWNFVVRVSYNKPFDKWLDYSVARGPSGGVEIVADLNAQHRFVSQFALGDKDSFEAVLRIAVGLVVAQSQTRDAGASYTNLFMQNLNNVLTRALHAPGD